MNQKNEITTITDDGAFVVDIINILTNNEISLFWTIFFILAVFIVLWYRDRRLFKIGDAAFLYKDSIIQDLKDVIENQNKTVENLSEKIDNMERNLEKEKALRIKYHKFLYEIKIFLDAKFPRHDFDFEGIMKEEFEKDTNEN